MPKARSNLLTGRLAEHLVCAELARIGLIATTFSHNVPTYDILATDGDCKTVPIQVKASSNGWWRGYAKKWMDIELNEKEKTQLIIGPTELKTLDPIWVCVAVGKKRVEDNFFILTENDLQKIIVNNYTQDLDAYAGKRPKNWEALDCWWGVEHISEFMERWDLVERRLSSKVG